MAVDNNTIMANIYLSATNDFQQRIPDPTQAGLNATMEALYEPMNAMYYNQFVDILINRVGLTVVRGKQWDNVLAGFKGSKLTYGSTIQEIAPKWIKAHSYDDENETLLKLHRPEAAAWYHSQNRRDQYPISINYDELRTAFDSEFGLNNFIDEVMTVPNSSDNYDEYRIMLQLLAMYEHKWGFFKYHLSSVPNDEATGKEFLTAIKTFAGKLQFPSTIYNAGAITDIPVFAKPSELIMMVTPETNASVDVNTLASIFHLDKADETRVTKVIVDEFPIPNAVALLTTRDFFVCHDTLYNTTNFYNPQTLTTTYYLNHWGVYSVSPFVPAILFTTEAGSAVNTVTQTVTGMTLTADAPTVEPGGKVGFTAKLTGNIDPATKGITVAPDAAVYEVSAVTSGGDALKLDSRTWVDNYGVLHAAESMPDGAVITVTAMSTYINPSGETEDYTAEASVTVAVAAEDDGAAAAVDYYED